MEPAPAAAPARSVPTDREQLLAAMAQACAAAPRAREPEVRHRLGLVFSRVLAGADPQARRRFALSVAADEWVSPELALQLARDRAEVAEPVIAASPALGEPELRHLLEVGSAEHRAAVARRPLLPARTAEAVVDTGEPLALAALASNPAADLPTPVLRRLVEASRTTVALRAPLARRSDLGAPLARLMAGWVSDDLRGELSARFALDGAESAPEPEDGADARLVRKLQAAGQLRAGFLLRTLREGRLELFRTALATLSDRLPSDIASALAMPTPDALAAACRAAGVDLSAFPTVLALVRGLNGGAPGGGTGAQAPAPPLP